MFWDPLSFIISLSYDVLLEVRTSTHLWMLDPHQSCLTIHLWFRVRWWCMSHHQCCLWSVIRMRWSELRPYPPIHFLNELSVPSKCLEIRSKVIVQAKRSFSFKFLATYWPDGTAWVSISIKYCPTAIYFANSPYPVPELQAICSLNPTIPLHWIPSVWEDHHGTYRPNDTTFNQKPMYLKFSMLAIVMSGPAGIRTRATSLEGLNPNQLDHRCLKLLIQNTYLRISVGVFGKDQKIRFVK